MKAAKEWSEEFGVHWLHCQGADEPCYNVSPDKISKVQADALRHAANLVSAYWASDGSARAVEASVKFLRKQSASLESK